MTVRPHQVILLGVDFFLMLIVFTFTLWFRYQSGAMNVIQKFPYHFLPIFAFFSVMSVIFFQMNNLYKYHVFTKALKQYLLIIKSFLFAFLCILLISFFLKHELLYQRVTLVFSFSILCLVFFVFRGLLLPFVYKALTGSGDLKKNIIIIGAGANGQRICRQINSNKNSYFSAIGFLDDKSHFQRQFFEDVPVLGRISDLEKVDRIHKIDEILITIDNTSHERLLEIIRLCAVVKKPIHVVSELYKVIPNMVEVEKFDGIASFRVTISTSRLLYFWVKRILDVTLSIAIIIALSPVLFTIALLIKLTSKGPVLYKRKVVGKDEKVFTFYKFRTMKHNNDDSSHQQYVAKLIRGEFSEKSVNPQNGTNGTNGNVKSAVFKIRNDPRITKVGRFLRKFSIDELPQLINVIKGEMSLIGPRPCTTNEFENYKQWHRQRFTVTPGITGLYQVTGRSAVDYDDMVVLDLYYKEHQSIMLDMEIALKTIPTMIFGKGAF